MVFSLFAIDMSIVHGIRNYVHIVESKDFPQSTSGTAELQRERRGGIEEGSRRDRGGIEEGASRREGFKL